MITQYIIKLAPLANGKYDCSQAYALYGDLLSSVPSQIAEDVHESDTARISQYLNVENGLPCWHVSLFGENTAKFFSKALENKTEYKLTKSAVVYKTIEVVKKTVSAEELLFAGGEHGQLLHMRFVAPTVFKSAGKYIVFPSIRLILQSLRNKWNEIFPEMVIEDEDGMGFDTMCEGLLIKDFNIRSAGFSMKKTVISGFVGDLHILNTNKGFHRQLSSSLLLLSNYSGTGAKATLGMGGTYTI